MTDPTDGGSAFPVVHPNPRTGERYVLAWGMSLRDYFAAQAMSALTHRWTVSDHMPDPDTVSRHAYEIADAMLKARTP